MMMADKIRYSPERALDSLLKKIQSAGARLDMVRSINLESRPGSSEEQANLLERVSPTVQTLRIEVPAYQDLFIDNLGDHLSDRSPIIRFPILTQVILGANSLRDPLFIPLLCTWAPNLYSLDYQINHYPSFHKIIGPVPSRKTDIRHLRMTVDLCLFDIETSDLDELFWTIHHSPDMIQLYVATYNVDEVSTEYTAK